MAKGKGLLETAPGDLPLSEDGMNTDRQRLNFGLLNDDDDDDGVFAVTNRLPAITKYLLVAAYAVHYSVYLAEFAPPSACLPSGSLDVVRATQA